MLYAVGLRVSDLRASGFKLWGLGFNGQGIFHRNSTVVNVCSLSLSLSIYWVRIKLWP